MSEHPPEFGYHAHNDGATQLTSEQRLVLSLVEPQNPLALTPNKAGQITKSRLRYMLAEVVSMNMENINKWLAQLAAEHPRAAIDALIELAKFATPQLKAVAVDIRENGTTRNYSITDLEKIVSEQGGGE